MDFKLSASYEIKLNCSPKEYLERLNEITRTEYGTGKEYNYEGKIDFEAETFELLQLFDYGNRNYIRPLIKGRLDGSICHINFKPIPLAKIFMTWSAIAFFIIVPVFMVINPLQIDLPFGMVIRILIGPLFFLLTWAMVNWQQDSKIDDNLKYLTNIANVYW